MFKKKLGFLLGIMLVLSLTGYLVCLVAGEKKQLNKEEEFLLVTSFYPMYVLAENLTAGVEGISVANLTENQTGCLHEYQLTSRDMKLLSQADAFLINGAGMELFIEKVLENNPELPVIEASHGMTLLAGVEHNHDHDHEQEGMAHDEEDSEHEKEHEKEHEEEHEDSQEEAGHTGHSHSENGHVWMDVERYRKQVVTVKEELQQLLPEQKEELEQAAAAYDAKLQNLVQYTEELREHTEGTHVVIFHEAFAYLAENLGMEVLMTLSLDEEAVPSAGEIAEVIEEINYHGGAYIFIEREHAAYADKIMKESMASVFYLDPLTTGDGDMDSYYAEMKKNLDTLSLIKVND